MPIEKKYSECRAIIGFRVNANQKNYQRNDDPKVRCGPEMAKGAATIQESDAPRKVRCGPETAKGAATIQESDAARKVRCGPEMAKGAATIQESGAAREARCSS
jgi:hypothetical protein